MRQWRSTVQQFSVITSAVRRGRPWSISLRGPRRRSPLERPSSRCLKAPRPLAVKQAISRLTRRCHAKQTIRRTRSVRLPDEHRRRPRLVVPALARDSPNRKALPRYGDTPSVSWAACSPNLSRCESPTAGCSQLTHTSAYAREIEPWALLSTKAPEKSKKTTRIQTRRVPPLAARGRPHAPCLVYEKPSPWFLSRPPSRGWLPSAPPPKPRPSRAGSTRSSKPARRPLAALAQRQGTRCPARRRPE